MRRIDKLAQPRNPFHDDLDENGYPRPWQNTQSVIWRIPKSALRYVPTQRIHDLSAPRKRPSARDLLNLDEEGNPSPFKQISEAVKNAKCSPRIESLARPIRKSEKWDENNDINKDIWRVSSKALKAIASPRLVELSKPRELPLEYYTQEIPGSGATTKPVSAITSRIERLALPINRATMKSMANLEDMIRERIRRAGMYHPTSRDTARARPIPAPDGYLPNKTFTEIMLVSPTALEYDISPRIAQLAQPKKRELDIWEQEFNPDAFLVSPAALTATPTERIRQLSKPVSR